MCLGWMEQPLYCSKGPCNFHCSKFWYLLLFDGSNNLSIAFAMGNLRIFNLLGGFLTSWGPTIIFTERKLKRLEYRDSEERGNCRKKKCLPPMTFDHPLCQTIQLFCTLAYTAPHFKETWRKNEDEKTGIGSCDTLTLLVVSISTFYMFFAINSIFVCI